MPTTRDDPRFLKIGITFATIVCAGIFLLASLVVAQPGVEEYALHLLRETNSTNRIVLTMLAASTFESAMDLRSKSSGSKTAKTIRVMFSIITSHMRINNKYLPQQNQEFDVALHNETHYFLTAVLTNNADLNRTCSVPANMNQVSFIDYQGWVPLPEGVANFTSYQVWYKCGLIGATDFVLTELPSIGKEKESSLVTKGAPVFVVVFGVVGVILLSLFFVLYRCSTKFNAFVVPYFNRIIFWRRPDHILVQNEEHEMTEQ
uniref:Uncharacterized protein n=1 Tax=Caenorhabditis japonica TaxID=281687 RepID=A0A8R1E407_CAEJA